MINSLLRMCRSAQFWIAHARLSCLAILVHYANAQSIKCALFPQFGWRRWRGGCGFRSAERSLDKSRSWPACVPRPQRDLPQAPAECFAQVGLADVADDRARVAQEFVEIIRQSALSGQHVGHDDLFFAGFA